MVKALITHRFLVGSGALCVLLSVFIGVLVLWSADAGARRVDAPAGASCTISYEEIFRFKDRGAASYTVWDVVHGEVEAFERFKAAVSVEGHVVALGERREQAGGPLDSFYLADFDRRGRLAWSRAHTIQGLERVLTMRALDDGFVVVGDQRLDGGDRALWLGFLDGSGRLVRQEIVREAGAELSFTAFEVKGDGSGYIAAASFKAVGQGRAAAHVPALQGVDKRSSALYHLSLGGELEKRVAFLPSADNHIYALKWLDQGGYVAAGYARNALNGRKAGWVMHIGVDVQLVSQYELARGSEAVFHTVDQLNSRFVVLGGVVEPGQGFSDPVSAMLMVMDVRSGEVLWQRYYTGDVPYRVQSVVVDDGVLSVLLQGGKEAGDGQGFVRVLSVSKRGNVLLSDSYYQGEGSHASDLFLGRKKERIFMGYSHQKQVSNAVEGEDPVILRSVDSWLAVGDVSPLYQDPCD